MNTNTIINCNLPLANTVDQNFQKEMQYVHQCKNGVLFEGSRIAVAEPKVSIVIPVYNKVKYLDLALRSSQNQTMRDLEIVCVDDGSTDGSIKKIESYMKDDPRIHLVKHANNEGTLKARCDGVSAAHGEFIMPLDPDDAFCNPKIAELAYNKAKEVGADIVQFQTLMQEIDGGLNLMKWGSLSLFTAVDNTELFNLFLDNKFGHTVWAKIIKRELYLKALDELGEEYLKQGIVANEDFPQNFMWFKLAHKYIATQDIGYWYRKNDEGVAFKPFEIVDGKLARAEAANKRIRSWVLHFNRLYDLTPAQYRNGLFITFWRIFCSAERRAISLSTHSNDVKNILNIGLECAEAGDWIKTRMRNFLNGIKKAELTKNN